MKKKDMKFPGLTMKYKPGNKNGFTLIEIIISLAILSIVVTAAYELDDFGRKTFKKSNDKADTQFDVRMAADFITKEIRYADSVQVLNSVPMPSAGFYDIYIDNGRIKFNKNGTPSSADAISNVSDFTLVFEKFSGNILSFTVGKAEDTGEDVPSKVEVLNIPSGQSIDGSSGIGVRFTLASAAPGALTDEESVAADKAWLNIPGSDAITDNIVLSPSGPNGTSIIWATSDSSVVSSSGNVTRPEAGHDDAVVTLTATISKGSASDTKIFTITVKAMGALTIDSIADIDVSVSQGESYSPPSTVTATMSNGSTQTVNITWSPSVIDTAVSGTKTSSGIVPGYDHTVALTVTVIPSFIINGSSQYSAAKGSAFTISLTSSGGTGPYTVSYSKDSENDFNPANVSAAADGTININGNASNGKNKKCTLTIILTDSNKKTANITITISTT